MCIILFQSYSAVSQSVVLKDVAFINAIKSKYPFAIDINNNLIVSAANSVTGVIDFSNKGITDISGIENFTQIIGLYITNNKLQQLPNISSLTNLEILYCDSNQLAQLPDLSSLTKLRVLFCSDNQLAILPNLTGLTQLQNIYCFNNKLTQLPALSTLSQLQNLFCYDNQLTQLPDLSNLPNLLSINFLNNKVTSLPALPTQLTTIIGYNNLITTLPDLSNLTQLTGINLNNNKISSISNLNTFTALVRLNLDSNQLTSIPDLSSLTALNNLSLTHNKLSFKYLIPLTNHPKFSSFIVFPQDTVGTVQNVKLYKNKPLILKANVDANISGLTYKWYKNNVNIGNTNVDSIIIQLSDTGVYYCIDSCVNISLLNNKSIVLQPIKVQYGCVTPNTINYTIESVDCKTGTNINLNETFNIGTSGPFNYVLRNTVSNDTLAFNSAKLSDLVKGNYDLTIKDNNNNCKIKLDNVIKIDQVKDCEFSVFTPDGDGLNDTYLIDQIGTAEIYNNQGKLVRKLTIPVYWDGKDQQGNIVNIGYYTILINGNNKMYVTIVN